MNERRDLSRRQTTRACRAAVMSLPFQVVQWNDEHTSMIGSNYYLDMEWVHCRVPQQFALLWLFTGGHIAYRLREMMGRKKNLYTIRLAIPLRRRQGSYGFKLYYTLVLLSSATNLSRIALNVVSGLFIHVYDPSKLKKSNT